MDDVLESDVPAWTMCPDALISDPELTLADKVIYMAVRSFVDEKQGQTCWPSVRSIAKRACVSTSTVSASVRALEGGGWLSRRPGQGPSDSTRYTIASVRSANGGVAVSATGVSRSSRQGVAVSATEEEPITRTNREKHTDAVNRTNGPADRDAAFDEVWRRWPNQTGKHRAWEEFRKRFASGARDPVIAACLTAGDHLTRADIEPRFVKQLGNWLAANEWRDWTDGPPPGAPTVKPDRAARDAAISAGVARVFAELESEEAS